MKNIQKKLRPYQALLLSVLTILFAIVGLLVGVVPLGQQAIATQQKNAALASEVAGLRTKNEILSSVDEETLRANLLTLLSAVPADKSLSTLFGTIDAITATSGVTVTDFTLARAGSLATESAKKLTTDEKETGANILPFSLTVEGTFEQLRAFLGTAVTIRRFFRIRSIEMTFKEGPGAVARVNMDAFYASIPASVGPVGSAITPLTIQESETISQTGAIQLVTGSTPEIQAVAPSDGAGKSDPFSP